MTYFRDFLIFLFLGMAVYTLFTIAGHGINFIPLYLSDIAAMTWRGQINLDFTGYLLLSGLWIAWRNGFSKAGCALGGAASILGMPVFSAYLLYLTYQSKGDMRQVLLGAEGLRLTRPA